MSDEREPTGPDRDILKMDLLETLCNRGHTNPTNISLRHLRKMAFREQELETLHECVREMIEAEEPIEYVTPQQEAIHVTDRDRAEERVQEVRSEYYNL